LESFIENNLWDEAFRFVGNKLFTNGIKSPKISGTIIHSEKIDSDQLFVYKNNG
jgi:diaminohydroxyphosphoribosylaminopyrimidine deaminase / 5-amino-6-(5-phosphoribosylamino)uracil reductase